MKFWFEMLDKDGKLLPLSNKRRLYCATEECRDECVECFREFSDVTAVRTGQD